jgi:hypothetical protein
MSVECERREGATLSHAYLSGEIRLGDIAAQEGVLTPIMCRPILFYVDVGGTGGKVWP